MYRDTGAGKEAVPPALLAMVILLQGYQGISDAEAVEMTVVDLRWQLVLGVLGATEPAFSQGALCAFRARLIEHDMDRRLLERTVELARRTKEFDWKRLPRDLYLVHEKVTAAVSRPRRERVGFRVHRLFGSIGNLSVTAMSFLKLVLIAPALLRSRALSHAPRRPPNAYRPSSAGKSRPDAFFS